MVYIFHFKTLAINNRSLVEHQRACVKQWPVWLKPSVLELRAMIQKCLTYLSLWVLVQLMTASSTSVGRKSWDSHLLCSLNESWSVRFRLYLDLIHSPSSRWLAGLPCFRREELSATSGRSRVSTGFGPVSSDLNAGRRTYKWSIRRKKINK